jgi:hypothetical protein
MTVTIGPFIAPTNVNGQGAGSIGATIFAFGEGTAPGNTNTPEPSTMALAVIGVLTIGGAAYRKIGRNERAG